MAANSGRGVVLGYLKYVLGFDSVAFEEGATGAEKRLKAAQKSLEATGKKIKGVGAVLSVGLTAPIVGVAGAFIAGARDIARSVEQIEQAARLSNVDVEQFQRLAAGAKTVGFEMDKLADIYKDTQDKVGDYIATGGGAMADFFENIAPKVGLTAKEFQKLSGPDALQAYYNALQKAGVSQSEMTFYMEALASDATALAPLLADNGKLMKEIGANAAVVSADDTAQFKAYIEANREMEKSMQKLTIALVSSGILEAITGIITKITEWTGELAKADPALLQIGMAVAGVAAAVGPLVMVVGSMVSGFGAVLPVLATVGKALIGLAIAGGPFTLILAAVAGVVAVWKNWDTIGPIVANMVQAVKTWIVDKLGAVWGWLKGKIDAVTGWFKDLYIAVVGNSYIPDMVSEIGVHMKRLDAQMVAPAKAATTAAAQAFADLQAQVAGIMSRIYPEIQKSMDYAADKKALEDWAKRSKMSVEALNDALRRLREDYFPREDVDVRATPDLKLPQLPDLGSTAKALQDQLKGVATSADDAASSFVQMSEKALNSLSNLATSIKSGNVLNILADVFNMFGTLSQIGLFGKGLQVNFKDFSGIAGFRANGGPVGSGRTYVVGERGPELFTPSSSGYIIPNRANDNGGRGGSRQYFDLRGAVMTQDLLAQMNSMADGAAMRGAAGGAALAEESSNRARARRIPGRY